MIGAGTFLNPLLKIVTTVAILAAFYFFILRPVLDTTEKLGGEVGRQIQAQQVGGNQGTSDFELDLARNRATSFADSLRSNWPEAFREVRTCIQDADRDTRAMKRCDDLGRRLLTQAQSDRTFSLSYADTLDSQGSSGEADRVRACIAGAGFQVGRIQRCRDLADRLVFG